MGGLDGGLAMEIDSQLLLRQWEFSIASLESETEVSVCKIEEHVVVMISSGRQNRDYLQVKGFICTLLSIEL